jgi:hypothetical protein
MDWQTLKEKAWLCFARASQFSLFCNLMAYLACCVIAHRAVGPTGYIGFLYHCCQWRGK